MFDEFRPSSAQRRERRRLGGSMVLATIIYCALGALIVGGTRAATRAVVDEPLVQVKFASPPPPRSAPEPAPELAPKPASSARPKAKRRALKPPDEVPAEKPAESEAPLSAPEGSGPVDGFTDGVEGGTGTASAPPPAPPVPPKPEPLVPPVAARGNAIPPYSASARRKQVEGLVVVSFEVLEDGRVFNVRIVSGPEELRESVLKTIATWHFQPATRGGKPVRSRQTKAIQFRLSDA